MTRVLGIDVGATKLLATVRDAAGVEHARLRRDTGPHLDPTALVETVALIADEVGPIGSIGIGFPGLTDRKRGVARSTVMLTGWQDVPLADLVAAATGVPCAVDNDVNNAARAESAARDGADLLFVGVGTGIGGAIVLDGRVWTGASGLAGEIGHVSVDAAGERCACGRRGCVGPLASGGGIERTLGLEPGGLPRALEEGRAATVRAVEGAGDALGLALGSALNLLDLDLVVIGGGVGCASPAYVEAAGRRARTECFREIGSRCRFETPRAGYDAGAIGAALLALEAGSSR